MRKSPTPTKEFAKLLIFFELCKFLWLFRAKIYYLG